MSNIEIRLIGITDLDTDCIVNAANSSLAMGSGVCGAIFKAAGASELQAACNSIGYCPTGGAVVTPGFALKAKYIVHAVGPVWHDGKHHEPQDLYSCYRESLYRAKENGCHSTGFPLISAGIFGYPKDKAWRKALQSCNDWISDNPEYNMDIVFAVLDQNVYDLGVKTMRDLGIAGKSYVQVHTFAKHYLSLFSDDKAEQYDLDGPEFGDACLNLGFRLDSCDSINKRSSNAMENPAELNSVIADINDINELGNAILSKWRGITHWTYDSVTDQEHKGWFCIALNRLVELTEESTSH